MVGMNKIGVLWGLELLVGSRHEQYLVARIIVHLSFFPIAESSSLESLSECVVFSYWMYFVHACDASKNVTPACFVYRERGDSFTL